MIFHNHRAIHFHSGKTAGTSIEEMLLPGDRDPAVADRDIMFGWDGEYRIYLQHATCKTVLEIAGEKIFDAYYKFCIVRNPYSRLQSVYYYGINQHEKEFGTFKKFILALPSRISDKVHLRGSHITPQILHTHIDGVSVCQSIGRFEELDTDLNAIKRDLKLEVTTPRLNTQRNKQFRKNAKWDHYDREMISVMQDVYGEDFETYGYDPEPPRDLRAGFLGLRRLYATAWRKISS
jgi:hypothetical protein